ncbi:two-component sensor histidine kinase [Plantactinospora sp. S1510]|uniref:histidine kinase n=2 Tax=Plantactinospora alkalitolerans TaxID=2789879 RepID=A0ABS0H5A4_9ACTN|nr:two-component sensor histidine kinase [Plantactinospora alkalitolerans]
MLRQRGGPLDAALSHRDRILHTMLWVVLSAPVALALATPPHPPWYGIRLAGSVLLLAVAVLACRRAPLLSLVLVVLPTAFDGNFIFAIPVFSYLLGLRERRAGPAGFTFAVIALGGTVLNLGLLGTAAEVWFLLASTLLVGGVFPWLVGRYHRQHRALVLAGWEQAGLLEREQQGVAERVRMRERARIAQDMHDSLGHDLSLIALRAGALEVAPELDERHRRAAGELRVSVALATDRLRQVIGVLRDDAESAPIRPAGESVADLVERVRAAGMSVRLLTDRNPVPPPALPGRYPVSVGQEPASVPEEVDGVVPPMVGRAIVRVVQEALTNATRHAPGAAVTVSLTHSRDRTSVRVLNDPPPAGPLPGPRTTGSGLVGLRERVRLAGGSLRAGPKGQGFEVLAELPHTTETAYGVESAYPVEQDWAGYAEPVSGLPAPSDAGGPATPEPARLGTAHRLRSARRRVRRSLVVAVAVPAAIGMLLVLAYYPIASFGAVLDSERYDRMRVGQDRAELRDLLPRRQVARPENAAGRPVPSGAACEFYSDGGLPPGQTVYQLCFLDGHLVVKYHLAG